MLRLVGLAISIGIADSLNPSTIAPALYLASGPRGRARVFEFTVGVFAVYFLGGALIALGPGQLLLSLIPRPHRNVAHIIEVAVGVAMFAGGVLLCRHRENLRQREKPRFNRRGRSSYMLGAAITAVELPTAFPYFAVIAAIVGSGVGLPRQLMLLLLFNVCFIAPLLGIEAILTFAGDQAGRILSEGRRFLNRHWPLVLGGLAMAAGIFVILLGVTGFAAHRRGRFGRFSRRFHRLFH